MTNKQNKTTGIEQNNAAKSVAADELAAARDNAVAAFKVAAKSAATQTTAALQFVAAYYFAKKTVIIDAETKKDLRKAWIDAGNAQKYESGVFYRVLKTCEKNAAYLTPRFDCVASNAAAAQAARDSLLALGVGLTSCKSAADSKESTTKDAAAAKDAATKSAPTEQATESAPTEQATESAPTEQATEQATAPTAPTEQATDKLQKILDFVATCNESALVAIKNAVAKREQVDRKLQAAG